VSSFAAIFSSISYHHQFLDICLFDCGLWYRFIGIGNSRLNLINCHSYVLIRCYPFYFICS